MNNQIRELVEQATTKISFRIDPNTYKHIDDPDGDHARFEFDKEKFAELIVKKCSEICLSNQFDGADNYNNGSVSYSELIKHNFGIE